MESAYRKFFDESMVEFIQNLLKKVQVEGLKDDHHFYISFKTNHPSVKLSPKMRQRYPEEITIVLQYNFYDLNISKDKFSVKLSFDGVPEVIEVPFESLTGFSDPSVKFSIQFKHSGKRDGPKYSVDIGSGDFFSSFMSEESSPYVSPAPEKKDNVVSLDQFRNKKKPRDS